MALGICLILILPITGTPAHDILAQPLSVDNPAHAANAQIQETSPFQKYDQLLHAGLSSTSGTRTRPNKKKNIEVLTLAFVKKYIQYAKARPAPVLTKGAADWIVNVYASLRNDNLEDNKRRVSQLFSCVYSFSYSRRQPR